MFLHTRKYSEMLSCIVSAYTIAVWGVIESMKPVCSAQPAYARTLAEFWEWKVNDRQCRFRGPCRWSSASFKLCENKCLPNLISSREFLRKEKKNFISQDSSSPWAPYRYWQAGWNIASRFLAWFLRKQGLCKHTGVCVSLCVYVSLGMPFTSNSFWACWLILNQLCWRYWRYSILTSVTKNR